MIEDLICPVCEMPVTYYMNTSLYAISKGRPRVKTYIHEQCYRKLTRGGTEQEGNHGEMQDRVQCDRSR